MSTNIENLIDILTEYKKLVEQLSVKKTDIRDQNFKLSLKIKKNEEDIFQKITGILQQSTVTYKETKKLYDIIEIYNILMVLSHKITYFDIQGSDWFIEDLFDYNNNLNLLIDSLSKVDKTLEIQNRIDRIIWSIIEKTENSVYDDYMKIKIIDVTDTMIKLTEKLKFGLFNYRD